VQHIAQQRVQRGVQHIVQQRVQQIVISKTSYYRGSQSHEANEFSSV
jgi:hypothetical protein